MSRIITFFLLFIVSLSINAQTNKELRDSLTSISKQVARNPESVDLRLKKAGVNLRLEQWDYACNEYNYVLSRYPDNISALYFRAYTYMKMGKYKSSRSDYQHLLTIVPGHFESQLGLALLNQKDKHYTEAMDLLNIICSQHPSRAEAFAARAGLEAERKLFDLAEYDIKEAIRLDPDNIDYRITHVDLLIKLNRKDEARECLEELVNKGVPRPNLEDLFLRVK